MNAQRTAILTHFGPLFAVALGGWTAFNLVDNGSVHLLPGMIVALVLAYAGTLVALRMRQPAAGSQQSAVSRRQPFRPLYSVRSTRYFPARDDMDVAAGD